MSQDIFDQLCFYTMNHSDPRFIHQHAVDAYAVQMADEMTKPIAVVFGGAITIADVIQHKPGVALDHAIHDWCVSVWEAYRVSHDEIATLLKAVVNIA